MNYFYLLGTNILISSKYRMTGIEEIIGVVGGVVLIYVGRKSFSKLKRKLCKKKLCKLLNKGFDDLNFDMVAEALRGLEDFDEKYNTRKKNKYIQKIIKSFKNDENEININESNLSEALEDFTKFDTIFDEDEDEMIEMENVVDDKLEEVMKRRKEVILRKNMIRSRNMTKSGKKRKNVGAMG